MRLGLVVQLCCDNLRRACIYGPTVDLIFYRATLIQYLGHQKTQRGFVCITDIIFSRFDRTPTECDGWTDTES